VTPAAKGQTAAKDADQYVDRLARLDTGAVSDALDQAGIAGVVDLLHPMWDCGPIVGRVITVRLEEILEGASPPSQHLGTAAIARALPGDVIVVDNGGRSHCAGWGGLLSLGAHLGGIGGVVVYGAARDVDETRELGLPLFATAATCRTARRRVTEVSTGEPIQLGDVSVETGDLIVADGSGVAFVPADSAHKVIELAESIALREAEMASRLRDGSPPQDVMGASYETMIDTHQEQDAL
jgi:regulator of RNase E activity RraA